VSAKDKATGKEQSITITGGSSLSDNEVKKMVDDAENYADADKKKKDLIESRNRLDTTVYQAEKMLNDNREQLSEETISGLEGALSGAKTVLDGDLHEEMDAAQTTLQNILHATATEMYQTTQAEATPAGPESDEPIDVEFNEEARP